MVILMAAAAIPVGIGLLFWTNNGWWSLLVVAALVVFCAG